MRFLSLSAVALSLAGFAAADLTHQPRHAHEDAVHELEARGLPSYSGKLPKHPMFVYNAALSGMPPSPSEVKKQGFNMLAMSFWRSSNKDYMNVKSWSSASKSKQKQIHAQYKKAGVPLLVAAFGDGDNPTSDKKNPVVVANNLAKWVKNNNVDGVDIDYEDFDACWDQKCANWVIRFHTRLRKQLGSKYIITHAPIAPWFTTDSTFAGGYLKVHRTVGASIDLYLMQFYNQETNYVNCEQLVNGGGAAESRYKETALMQMIANGIPKEKLLIGKPATKADAGSGYTQLSTLKQCVNLAQSKGWNTGLMSWAWPHSKQVNFVKNVWSD